MPSFNTTAKYRKVAGEELKEWYNKLWEKKDGELSLCDLPAAVFSGLSAVPYSFEIFSGTVHLTAQ